MITLPRNDIFDKLALAPSPISVRIELTRRCNLDCVHCLVRRDIPEQDELSTAEMDSLLNQLVQAGVFHLNITGGEPALRPDFPEILRLIFAKQFYLSLQTNGTLLDDKTLDLLVANKNNIKQIGISLYGAVPGPHEAVTRTPGSFELSRNAALRLKAAGLPILIVSLMTSINHGEFEAIRDFCSANGLPFQFNTVIIPRDDGDPAPCSLRLTDEELAHLPKPWETFSENKPIDTAALCPDSPLSAWCSMGHSVCYITSRGDVRACSVVTEAAGNLRNASFADIWNGSEFFKRIRSMKVSDLECSKCEHFPKCRPCPGLAFLEHGSLTSTPKEICRITSAFMKRDGEDK